MIILYFLVLNAKETWVLSYNGKQHHTHIQQKKRKKKRRERERERETRLDVKKRINAIDIHDFTMGPADEKEKRRSTISLFLLLLLYHVRNVKRNKANLFSLSPSSF